MPADLGYEPPVFMEGSNKYWKVKFDTYIENKPQYNLTHDEYHYVRSQLLSVLEKYVKPTRVLDVQDVMDGIEGELDSMTHDTSPSWPFTLNFKTKKDALDNIFVNDLIDLQWQNWLEEVPFSPPVTLHAKDEVLPIEKKYKPRPFYSVDVVTNLNSARLVCHFNKQVSGHILSPIMAGFNPFSNGYHRLFYKHYAYEYHLAGDLKQMDGSKQIWMSLMKADIRSYFFNYDRDTTSRILSMYSILDQAYCLDLDGKFRKRFGQNVTGHRATLEDNCLDMWMITELAIYRANKKGIKIPRPIMSIMGDDSIFSFNSYFDPNILAKEYKDMGYTFTPPNKDAEASHSFQDLYDIDFLKFKFMKLPNGRISGIYEQNKMLSILKWQKSKEPYVAQKINSVLLMTYGSSTYTLVRNYAAKLIDYGHINCEDIHTHNRVQQILFSREATVKFNTPKNYQSITRMNTENKEPANNDVDGDMFSDLQSNELQTEAPKSNNPAISFLQKVLHPPSAVPGFNGLPTNDVRSQVLLEYRNMELNVNPVYFTSPTTAPYPNTLPTFDICYLMTNGMRVLNIPFVTDPAQPTQFVQDLANTSLLSTYDASHLVKDAQLYRTIYKSTTFYLNATAFNNTGMVTSCQFNPNILFSGTLLGMSNTNPAMFYDFVSQKHNKTNLFLANPNYEQLANWDQFPHYHRQELLRRLKLNPKDSLNIDPNASIQILSLGLGSNGDTAQPIPTSSQILQQSMRSYGGRARDGAFVVQKLNTIAPAWTTAGNTARTPPGVNNRDGLFECYFYLLYPDGGGAYTPFIAPTAAGVPIADVQNLYDTLWTKDMTFSWVRFSGLNRNITTTGDSTQLMIVKTYLGFELQPSLVSPFAGVQRVAPKPDLEAMQAMMDAFYELKDCLPARYNFWGTIGNLALGAIKTFGGGLLKNLTDHVLSSGEKRAGSKPDDGMKESGFRSSTNKKRQRNGRSKKTTPQPTRIPRPIQQPKEVRREKNVATTEQRIERKIDRLTAEVEALPMPARTSRPSRIPQPVRRGANPRRQSR